jgi:PAS domain S-box-containing protein
MPHAHSGNGSGETGGVELNDQFSCHDKSSRIPGDKSVSGGTGGTKPVNNAHLAAIVESSTDAIISKDLNSIVTSWNAGAEKIFGYSAAEMIGQPITRIIPPDRQREEDEIIARIKRGERVDHFETVRRCKDGQLIHVSVLISPIKDANGHIVGASKVARDITKRVKAEEALRHAEETLRTQAEDLERSNKDLEQFAYVASHDLQEPLRAVAGCLQVLQRRYQGKMDARADELIGHAVDGSHRMQTLIEGLLAFSRVGTRGGEFKSVSCDEAIDSALNNLATAIQESGAIITRDKLPALKADPLQLALLFQNLIGNAIKFRGDRAPEIHVGAEHKGGHWILSVKDNGIGIEPQYFERIFVIFQRLHTRKEYPGSGIGLSICKKIVERHGGRISVASTPGQGCTFYCNFPA